MSFLDNEILNEVIDKIYQPIKNEKIDSNTQEGQMQLFLYLWLTELRERRNTSKVQQVIDDSKCSFCNTERKGLYCYNCGRKFRKYGTSIGIIKPILGDSAQQFLEDAKRNVVDSETIKKCEELSKQIKK